jgi:hypothetical protein
MNKTIASKAFHTRNVQEFINLVFPDEWAGVGARIIETGVQFSDEIGPWAARWTPVPPTVKYGKNDHETHVKSIFFRLHDLLHQLFGIPVPVDFSDDEFYMFKRSVMCSEVAVLTLTEFIFGKHVYDNFPDLRPLIESRNAVPMLFGPLKGKDVFEIAARMDDILHKKSFPKWVRDSGPSVAFYNDYVPMLERDREDLDHQWSVMKRLNWTPKDNALAIRYDKNLDGLELTIFMIREFLHQCKTAPIVDISLAEFNRKRRANIILPKPWHKQF